MARMSILLMARWAVPLVLPLTAAVACVRGAAPSTAPSATRPPNVIFILADDLGWGDPGCYGQKRI